MPEGCALVPIEPEAALKLVQGVAGGMVDGDVVRELTNGSAGDADPQVWLLAHTDSGVTWGLVENGTMRLSSRAVAAWPTPPIDPGSLQQLRVFGAHGEILIWRDEDHRAPMKLRGRKLLDREDGSPPDTQPRVGRRVVAASRVAPRGASVGGFTAVAEGNGRTQVVPLALSDADFAPKGRKGWYPLALEIKEYFERDPDTGCVRIAASRLVGLIRRKER